MKILHTIVAYIEALPTAASHHLIATAAVTFAAFCVSLTITIRRNRADMREAYAMAALIEEMRAEKNSTKAPGWVRNTDVAPLYRDAA